MDYETKILLNKLVEFITNPAWWSVIATFVTAIVAAWITSKFSKRQNELQEQQLKIQERQNELQEYQLQLQAQQVELQKQQNSMQAHKMRKMIYNFMHDINSYAAILPTQICDFLRDYKLSKSKKSLDEITNGLVELTADFEDKILDINMHLSELEAFDCDDVTHNMIRIIEGLEEIIDCKGLKDDYQIKDICSMHDSDYVDAILECIKDEFVDDYRLKWTEFLESKEVLRELMNSILTK